MFRLCIGVEGGFGNLTVIREGFGAWYWKWWLLKTRFAKHLRPVGAFSSSQKSCRILVVSHLKCREGLGNSGPGWEWGSRVSAEGEEKNSHWWCHKVSIRGTPALSFYSCLSRLLQVFAKYQLLKEDFLIWSSTPLLFILYIYCWGFFPPQHTQTAVGVLSF